MTGLPSGPRRLLRRPARVCAAAALAIAVALTPVLERSARDAAERVLDEQWRGLYDLLVLAGGAEPVSDEDATDVEGRVLVDPNFGNVSATPIPRQLVEAVADVTGVEVSAPVGFVGRWTNTMEWPILSLPMAALADDPVQLLRIGWRVMGDDGLSERLLQDETDLLRVDASRWDGRSGSLDDVGVTAEATIPVDGFVEDGVLGLSWWTLPVVASTVFAVDPAAERMLLGPDAGSFLDSLIAYQELLEGGTDPVTASAVAVLDPTDPVRSALVDLPGAQGALSGMYGTDNPLTPYLRNEVAYPPTTLSVAVERAQEPGADLLRPGLSWTRIGTSTVDLSSTRRPFAAASIPVPWPGTEAVAPNYFANPDVSTGLTGLTLSRAGPGFDDPGAEDHQRTRLVAQPRGFVRPVPNHAAGALDGTGLGQEQTYRDAAAGTGARLGTALGTVGGAAPVDVGTYRPTEIAVNRRDAGYVPLGAYDPGTVTVSGRVLEPTSHGLGLAAQPSSALVSLEGAAAFGVADPVTAIRVRVGGVEDYSTDSLAAIARVAERIESLGLRVHTVAGASPQQVDVWVPEYAYGTTSADRGQDVGALGWAQVPFTTIGAAITAEERLSGLAARVAAGALAVAVLAVAVVWLAAAAARRVDDAVLRSAGLPAWRRWRWFAAEDAAALTVVLAGAVAALAFAGGARSGPVATLGVAAVPAVAAAVLGAAIVWVVRPPRAPGSSRGARRTARPDADPRAGQRQPTVARVAGATLRHGVGAVVVTGVGLGIAAATTGLGVAVVVGSGHRLSLTAIGALLRGAVWPTLLALIGVAAACGVLMCAVAGRIAAERRADRARVLSRSAGWSVPQVRALAAVEHSAVAGVALVVAGAILAGTAPLAAGSGPVLPVAVAAAGWCAGTCASVASGRKVSAR